MEKPHSFFPQLASDGRILFVTRITRLFAYGFLSVILVLYLKEAGLTDPQVGLLLTLTLAGDTLISLWITTHADNIGRRRMLQAGAALMVFAGGLFALTHSFWLLLFAATVGVISPSGNEVGPFLAIEQASLSQLLPGETRTHVFAWYNLVGSFATALGALVGGGLSQLLANAGWLAIDSYRLVVLGYAAIGLLLGLLFLRLSQAVEAPSRERVATRLLLLQPNFGLRHSRNTVLRLAGLFTIDAFAGGFVVQSIVAYWFHLRFNLEPGALGGIFFGANLLAGLSALSAAGIARRIGLIRTMVYTHIPSNVLLILVPLMPNLPLAVAMLFLRFSISQMDVPTRQSYTMAVVAPDERSAAAGVTGIARTTGAAVSPVIATSLLGIPMLFNAPFIISGALKIIYDVLLYRSFSRTDRTQ